VTEPTVAVAGQRLPRVNLLVILLVFGLVGAVLLGLARRDYPNLHMMLDTAMALLSAVLALLFWDLGLRSARGFPQGLAASFAVVSLLEIVHALVSVEWSGPLASIAQLAHIWRPSTWPPAAHILPIGIGCSMVLMRARQPRTLALALILIALSAALFALFRWLPRYSTPTILGITRPTLILVPILWAGVGWLCWRRRTADRLVPALTSMSAVMLLAHLAMLYSRAPHDSEAMVAHLGKVAGYLLLLLTVLQTASADMMERIGAEKALARLNDELDRRVTDRTAQLAASNQALEAEVATRRQTEVRLQAQLVRLSLLDRITHAIGERQDLDSIFLVVVRNLEDQLPVDFGCVCLCEAGSGSLTVARVGVVSRPIAEQLGLLEKQRIVIDENGLSRCIRGQLVYEPDIGAATFPFPQRLAQGGLRSLVCAPLQTEGKVFGVLLAARRAAGGFSSGECEFLRQLSEHVALAASQAQTHGALQQAYDDLRETKYTVMQQERLRALGQMASGIAHDINNALSPVGLYTESLLDHESGLSERGRAQLAIIQRSIEGVSETVGRMREFYRSREPEQQLAAVQLNSLVLQVIELTRARWHDEPQKHGTVIELKTDLCADLPAIAGAQNEIRDALTNLIFNAVDAMPEGGIVTLKTLPRTLLRRPGVPDQQVLVEVIDSGTGMSEATRQRCLEPFFTTKGERGTGLGLAMVYGMVQRHGGELEIESEPGRGAHIRLLFPVANATMIVSQHDLIASAPRAPLRILVIDDDPVVMKSLEETLQGDGHRVTVADGGQAGIDAFEAAQPSERFDVVITDLGMPYVDGRKVAAKVRTLSPTTPIVLLTGWGERLSAERDIPAEVRVVLSKPPKLSQLRATLAEVTAG